MAQSSGPQGAGHQWLAPLWTFLGLAPYQSLTGAGAVDPNKRVTFLTTTGAAQAITLADGVYIGQTKEIIHEVDGGDAVLTPASPEHFATIDFVAAHDWAKLMWTGTKWRIAGYVGVSIA